MSTHLPTGTNAKRAAIRERTLPLRLLQMGCWGLALTLIGGIILASVEERLFVELANIAGRRWGAVTLLDLGAGLAFVALWIGLLEQRWWSTLAWIVALLCLGNLTTLVFLSYRCWTHKTVNDALLKRRKATPDVTTDLG